MMPSKENVPKMFDQISKTYDRLNAILSFGMDQSWRRRVASHLPDWKNLNLLDLACGTGDQLIASFESGASIRSAVGIDLADNMLLLAKHKLETKAYKERIQLRSADCLKLPFPNASFDAATCSFGIRNVSDPLTSLKEIYRILKPSGRCLILEFSLPPQPIQTFHLFYLRHILPRIGALFSKDKTAYRYLNQTIETFPCGSAFCCLMKSASFSSIREVPMALGAVTLYLGDKR